ncbi:hypothetical protein B0H11DRAFT_2430903 [Mycena galericulata]|nr:hypothetical protein B0H11DRAFT_2430903 [Mycena galericulata]
MVLRWFSWLRPCSVLSLGLPSFMVSALVQLAAAMFVAEMAGPFLSPVHGSALVQLAASVFAGGILGLHSRFCAGVAGCGRVCSFSADDVILLAAYASRTENQDTIDTSVPFNPMDKCTEITYREELTGGQTQACHQGHEQAASSSSARATGPRSSRANWSRTSRATPLVVSVRSRLRTYEELDGDAHEAEGNAFELIELFAIFDPPRGCKADD